MTDEKWVKEPHTLIKEELLTSRIETVDKNDTLEDAIGQANALNLTAIALCFAEAEPTPSPNEIKEMPANFKQWAMPNKERLSKAQSKGTIPHWIKDNFTVRKNGTLRSHSHEKQVQKAWLKRNRQQSLEMAKKALIGTTAHHAQIGEIHFTGNLIKEAINQPHKNLYYKNLSIIEMRSIIPRATFEGSSLDTKGRGWKFHYLKYNLRGEPAYIVIREIKGKSTFYSIVERLNKK